jgi:Tol biopolymer transport system component
MRLLVTPPSGSYDLHASWSPDGSRLVFARYLQANTDAEHDVLMVVNADGSGLHRLAPGCTGACGAQCAKASFPCPGDDYPSWSPDGRRIAFEQTYGSDLRHLTVAIWVANTDGSHAHQLTQPQLAKSEDHSPGWSPDSRQIVFNRISHASPTKPSEASTRSAPTARTCASSTAPRNRGRPGAATRAGHRTAPRSCSATGASSEMTNSVQRARRTPARTCSRSTPTAAA